MDTLREFAALVILSVGVSQWFAWMTAMLLLGALCFPRRWPDGDPVHLRDRAAVLHVFAVPIAMFFYSAALYGSEAQMKHGDAATWRTLVLVALGLLQLPLAARVVFIYRRWPFIAAGLALLSVFWVVVALVISGMALSDDWS